MYSKAEFGEEQIIISPFQYRRYRLVGAVPKGCHVAARLPISMSQGVQGPQSEDW